MARLLLQTLCLSIFISLCLKAQTPSTFPTLNCESDEADCLMLAFDKSYLKFENFKDPSPTLTAATLSCQSGKTDCAMIAFDRGNLKFENVREITFDILLSDENDRRHLAETPRSVYYENTTCGNRTVTVTVNGRKNITYNIVSPNGLCLGLRSNNNGNGVSPLTEAIVMLVSGYNPNQTNNWYYNMELILTYIDCGGDCIGTGKVFDKRQYPQTVIYPNPATSFFTLKTPITSGIVNIFNTSGQLIYQNPIIVQPQSIPTSNWQNGLYFVEIIDFQTQAIEQHKLNIIK